jgi:putative transposase
MGGSPNTRDETIGDLLCALAIARKILVRETSSRAVPESTIGIPTTVTTAASFALTRQPLTLQQDVNAPIAIAHACRCNLLEPFDQLRLSSRGTPPFLRSDNGPEFVSKALLCWIVAQGIGTALIEPGKPWQNGVTESFNGKFRDECLSLEWFRSRAEAKVIIEAWWRHYNEVRPHSSLGYLTPNEFVARQKNPAPRQATGQGDAVRGPPRPGPLHKPLRKEHMQQIRDAVSG